MITSFPVYGRGSPPPPVCTIVPPTAGMLLSSKGYMRFDNMIFVQSCLCIRLVTMESGMCAVMIPFMDVPADPPLAAMKCFMVPGDVVFTKTSTMILPDGAMVTAFAESRDERFSKDRSFSAL